MKPNSRILLKLTLVVLLLAVVPLAFLLGREQELPDTQYDLAAEGSSVPIRVTLNAQSINANQVALTATVSTRNNFKNIKLELAPDPAIQVIQSDIPPLIVLAAKTSQSFHITVQSDSNEMVRFDVVASATFKKEPIGTRAIVFLAPRAGVLAQIPDGEAMRAIEMQQRGNNPDGVNVDLSIPAMTEAELQAQAELDKSAQTDEPDLTTSAQKPCPTDPDAVAALPAAEQRHCNEDLAALKLQADAAELARIEAAPRVVPPVETLSPEDIKERGTPVPAGVIPESEMFVKEIPPLDRVDGPSPMRPDAAESVWRAGARIDSRSNSYGIMYIYTGYEVCGIGLLTDAVSKQFPRDFYECPDSKNARLVITGIDLKTYIVSWKDQNGRTGTFDLVNHIWSVS